MKKKINIGDVFEVDLGNGTKGYVQYIADDMTQLNSQVIRVFEKKYPEQSKSSLEDIINDNVEFYMHIADIKHGEKDSTWRKIGETNDVGDIKKPIFRSSSQLVTLYSPSHISKHWYIWRIGEDQKYVGARHKLLPQSDIGLITWPESVKERMITGKYHGFFPKYEGQDE